MNVAVPVTTEGEVDRSWGRAPRVAVAAIDNGQLVAWHEFPVGWDQLHDEGTEGGHHARIARFLRDQQVAVVVAGHMGPPMVEMLERMGISAVLGVTGDARIAAAAAASTH